MAKNLHEIIITDDGSQNIIESDFGKEVQRTKDYGCGIDVHSAFIQVSVLVKSELSIFEFRKQFDHPFGCKIHAAYYDDLHIIIQFWGAVKTCRLTKYHACAIIKTSRRMGKHCANFLSVKN